MTNKTYDTFRSSNIYGHIICFPVEIQRIGSPYNRHYKRKLRLPSFILEWTVRKRPNSWSDTQAFDFRKLLYSKFSLV